MYETSKLLPILSDQPADKDQIDFAPYAKILAQIVADSGTDTLLTIGVFGGWGRGKTSLMRMVQRRLEKTDGTKLTIRGSGNSTGDFAASEPPPRSSMLYTSDRGD